MNRRPSGLSVSKALAGFLNTKAAEGLSPRTLTNYEFRLKQWIDFAEDPDVETPHWRTFPKILSYATRRPLRNLHYITVC